MTTDALLLSCEHGGARIPPRYQHLFERRAGQRALGSHRGCDLGALPLARRLSRALHAPLRASTVSRLLVDLNRSIGHPSLFSEFSQSLDATERERLLARHYFPHRNGIESWIEERCRSGHRVVHVGVHSFAPSIEGSLRIADVGLLYDPARESERLFCKDWKETLADTDPHLCIRRNYPYLGKADGLVTYLRAVFDESQYLGIEIELNQALLSTKAGLQRAGGSIAQSLQLVMLNAPDVYPKHVC
jgi:predicted N-formylglutamate amidohydrolase